MSDLKCFLFFVFSSGVLLFADERPNIVLIMADDMGYSDLGCYGGEIETPHLDRLAAKGMRYSQMYNTSKCTTTRSALLTGRYVTRSSWAGNYDLGPTFGEVAKAAGYRTLWSGKNHSALRPPERGFDRFYGFQGGACSFWNPGPSMQDGSAFPHIAAYEWMVDDKWLKTYIPEDSDYYMTDVITDNALNWLDEYKSEEKPFLLYLAYNAPHWPLHARPEDIAKYEGRYDSGYQVIQKERYERMLKMGIVDPDMEAMYPQEIEDWENLSKEEQALETDRMEIHAAMVDSLDQNIGRVVEALEKQGELDNTLILFLVDNGASHERTNRHLKNFTPDGGEDMGGVYSYECIGRNWAQVVNCPLSRHKTTSHEGGVRTPMIAHWPKGIESENSWSGQTAHLVDIMSTVIELSEGVYPEEYDGKSSKPFEGLSLAPSFKGEPLAKREYSMGFDFGAGQGLREGRWKLVKFRNGDWELYDMKEDRTETRNLAMEMPEKVEVMATAFQSWASRCEVGINKK